MTPELPQFLLQYRVVTDNGCWEWLGLRLASNYGTVRWMGKYVRVNRLVLHLLGKIDINDPKQLSLHKCDNPPCFNPDHLFAGTHADNMQDLSVKGTTRLEFCKRGHKMEGWNVKHGFQQDGTTPRRRCKTCKNLKDKEYNKSRLTRRSVPKTI